jgi:single-strand DNA-binding protein
MNSLNRTSLIGNLGAAPELRRFPDGRPVATFSVATSEKWKDRKTGEAREKTEWHRVVAFDGLAEVVAEYASKGRQVYVEGPSRTREWTDKDGVRRFTTEVFAKEVKFLGPKTAGEVNDPPKQPVPSFDESGDDDVPF